MTGLLPGLEAHAGRNVALGQWDSLPTLARALVRWANAGVPIRAGDRVLEPSCGIGNIAVAARDLFGADVHGIELDPGRAALARARGIRVDVADFLATTPPVGLQRPTWSLGNPPFEEDGETRHVLHASRWAHRVAAILRLDSLSSAARLEHWRQLYVRRVAVCVPRPKFSGSSGMSEIVFVDVERRLAPRPPGESDTCQLGWMEWEALGVT